MQFPPFLTAFYFSRLRKDVLWDWEDIAWHCFHVPICMILSFLFSREPSKYIRPGENDYAKVKWVLWLRGYLNLDIWYSNHSTRLAILLYGLLSILIWEEKSSKLSLPVWSILLVGTTAWIRVYWFGVKLIFVNIYIYIHIYIHAYIIKIVRLHGFVWYTATARSTSRTSWI